MLNEAVSISWITLKIYYTTVQERLGLWSKEMKEAADMQTP